MTPGLDRVTVAPGRTAPDSSVIVPPIEPTPWATTGVGSTRRPTNDAKTTLRIADTAYMVISFSRRVNDCVSTTSGQRGRNLASRDLFDNPLNGVRRSIATQMRPRDTPDWIE